jgi:hypothetical protein
MWKPIADAPKDGTTIWVGNTATGEMRLAKWGRYPRPSDCPEIWKDVIFNDSLGPAEVSFMPDVYTDIPSKPTLDEQRVDHLAEVFWQAHREPMLAACNNVVEALEGKEAQNEKLKEAVRIGVRAVLNELT